MFTFNRNLKVVEMKNPKAAQVVLEKFLVSYELSATF